MSTIYAPATAPGQAGIAVVRVSGPEAGTVLDRLAGGRPVPRKAVVRWLNIDDEPLDLALVLWFPAPASFTGEDVVELHLHGGRAVVAAVLDALSRLPGLRPAEAGAFTHRAFDHGKLDLTAVEGLADLVAAETEAQRRLALRQSGGALARLYDDWRERLLTATAMIEAAIDFPDEDLPASLIVQVHHKMKQVREKIQQHLADGHRGERLREGLHLAIVGAPNVGKSSLLNRLARREAAIVSRHPGTTRDVIDVALDLGGYPVTIADTAGLRESGDEIEAEGVRRALARAEAADLKLAVFAATTWPDGDRETRAMLGADTLVVVNKIDLCLGLGRLDAHGSTVWPISCLTGAGIDALVAEIGRRAEAAMDPGLSLMLSRARHRLALDDCVVALGRGLDAPSPEFLAEDLRLAIRALGRITGRVDVEDVLDRIFAEFCIGK